MTGTLLFSPLLGWIAVWAALICALAIAALGLWFKQSGWALRTGAALVLALALANPALQRAQTEKLSDIVVLVVDETASQQLGNRAEATLKASTELQARLAQLPNTELRLVSVGDDETGGTKLMSALTRALADLPAERLAGILLLTDGRVHDLENTPLLPAPTHVILTGETSDWDRRLILKNAPAYAILGEPFQLRLRIEDEGRAPEAAVQLTIAIDGAEPMEFTVPTGRDIELPVTLSHGGVNVLQFQTPEAEGELTARNNAAVVQINGVRDRMQVLLVSGEPHAGERTWRNLLKSDPSVDLVHFTILRPAEKVDNTPAEELALIAFPTRELFADRINDFDLIIFDRFTRLSLVSNEYLQNVVNFVQKGGALLLASGPEFAQADSVFRTPLAQILPAQPTAEVIEESFLPILSPEGLGHPVTAGLGEGLEKDAEGNPLWGHWLRLVATQPAPDAQVLMTGAGQNPLLLLSRVGQGRVGMLTSDQAWLWARGYEGGGPHVELLRRLSHWLMREPDLEEEALWAEPLAGSLRIVRRSMAEDVPQVEITSPSGVQAQATLEKTAPGRFEAVVPADEMGLYRLKSEALEAVVALGPTAPREFEQTLATSDLLAPASEASGGGLFRVEERLPELRLVAEGRSTLGPNWAGLIKRDITRVLDLEQKPLLPVWLLLLLSAGMMLWAWLREGRR